MTFVVSACFVGFSHEYLTLKAFSNRNLINVRKFVGKLLLLQFLFFSLFRNHNFHKSFCERKILFTTVRSAVNYFPNGSVPTNKNKISNENKNVYRNFVFASTAHKID